MTRDRINILIDLVIDSNERLRDKGVSASLDVSKYHTDVNVFYREDKTEEPGITMYSYTCPAYTVVSAVRDGIRTIYDPELKHAEDHLRRLLNDVDR